MCGLVGIFYKGDGPRAGRRRRRADVPGPLPAGAGLHRLRRVPARQSGTLVVRVDLDRPDLQNAAELTVIAAEQLVMVKEWKLTAPSVRLEVDSDADGKLADWIEERVEGARVFSIGRAMEIVKDVGSADEVDAGYGVSPMAGTPRHRPHPHGDREPGRHRPLPPVLGPAVPRHRRRPQRPDHQLPQAAAPARDEGPPVRHRQRLRGDRRLHRRPARGGRDAGGRRCGPRSATSTARSPTSSRPPAASASPATSSPPSRCSTPRTTSSSSSPPRRSRSAPRSPTPALVPRELAGQGGPLVAAVDDGRRIVDCAG